MLRMQRFAAMAQVEVARLAPGAVRIEAASAADAPHARDRIEQRTAPLRQATGAAGSCSVQSMTRTMRPARRWPSALSKTVPRQQRRR